MSGCSERFWCLTSTSWSRAFEGSPLFTQSPSAPLAVAVPSVAEGDGATRDSDGDHESSLPKVIFVCEGRGDGLDCRNCEGCRDAGDSNEEFATCRSLTSRLFLARRGDGNERQALDGEPSSTQCVDRQRSLVKMRLHLRTSLRRERREEPQFALRSSRSDDRSKNVVDITKGIRENPLKEPWSPHRLRQRSRGPKSVAPRARRRNDEHEVGYVFDELRRLRLRFQKLRVPFSNYITREVPRSSLSPDPA